MSQHTQNGFSGLFGQTWQRIARVMERQASRRELAELDDAALHDLGISRAQARFEADRAPWDDGPTIKPKRHVHGLPLGLGRLS